MSPRSVYTIKYHSIRDQIRTLLDDLEPGEALPPERTLAARFGVSRMTLRRAVEELIADGRLIRRQGAGTFVAEQKISQGVAGTSFSEDMRSRGSVPSSRTLDVTDVLAGPQLGRRLGIPPDARVRRITRLRLADDEPMAVESLHVPHDVAPELDGAMLAGQSFYTFLQQQHGLVLAGGTQTIEATVTDEHESAMLEVGLHSPAFLFERTSRSTDGRVVEFVRSVYRGDRYKFEVQLEPQRRRPGGTR
ncbi:MAG TPA: GntR family transcriptional regulator [Jiangellaceae bacterium]|nr:GntR family transcriptional regulator [Jiangellaceae bacterium]